jgi:hypothetical protein
MVPAPMVLARLLNCMVVVPAPAKVKVLLPWKGIEFPAVVVTTAASAIDVAQVEVPMFDTTMVSPTIPVAVVTEREPTDRQSTVGVATTLAFATPATTNPPINKNTERKRFTKNPPNTIQTEQPITPRTKHCLASVIP